MPWAYRAACESPSTAVIGRPASTPPGSPIRPSSPGDGVIAGRAVAGCRTGRAARRSSCRRARRAAGCGRRCPPRSGGCRSARTAARRRPCRPRRPGARSSSQRSFAALNIGSSGRPLIARTGRRFALRAQAAQKARVRWSCQPSTGPAGRPVRRSHTTRRLALSAEPDRAYRAARDSPSRHCAAAASTLSRISLASCSTQPGRG